MAYGTKSLRSVRAVVRMILIGAVLPDVVAAQTAAATPSDDEAAFQSNLQIENVIVTAQLREENLQDVPLSALIVAEPTRTRYNLQSLGDLTQTVPSVHIGTNGRSNDLYIRGIGSGVNSSFDQSVGTFVDGIFRGRSRLTSASFLDLDRIEILKGPQSTFFGNNSIAGAFNIVTRKADDSFTASGRGLYGEDGLYTAEAAIGGPVIGDTLKARFAVMADGMDGWLNNLTAGNDSPEEENAAARLTLGFTPDGDLDMELKVEGTRNQADGAVPNQIVNCPAPAPFMTAGFCGLALAQGFPTGLDAERVATSPGQEISLDTFETVLKANYTLNAGHTITSISGYYDFDYNLNLDPDTTPLSLFHAQVPEKYNQFSQEFRFTSVTGGRFEYLAGAYFQKGDLDNSQNSTFFFLNGNISGAPALAPLVPFLPLGQSITFNQEDTHYSVFGSLAWNVSNLLKLSAGVRGTQVEKDFIGNLFYGTGTQLYGGIAPLPANLQALAGALNLGVPYSANLSRTDDAVLPSFSAQYKVAESAMVYGSYDRGFKSGGFNAADTTGNPANIPFDEEYVNAYEIGIKSKLFDERVLLNAALFYSEYEDLQVAALQQNAAGTFINVVQNAAQSISQGVELETQWAVTRNFRLGLEATYLDAYYDSFPNAAPSSIQVLNGATTQDLSDRPTQFAPHTSGSFTAAFSPTFGSFQWTTELRAYYSSSYYLTGTIDDQARQDEYVRLDALLSFGKVGAGWSVDVIGRNLTDEDILVLATAYPTSNGTFLQQKQQPRNVALQARFRF